MNRYCFKKVWWVLLLLVLFFLPLGINSLYLYDAWGFIFEAPSEWTKFWGGYLGAIISGVVAFIILYIQRKDNQKQNDENKNENIFNRKLALYQLEKQRIDDFRNIYTQYMTLINTNDLLEIGLQIKESYPIPTLFQNLRKPNDDFKKANIIISLYPLNDSSNTKTFIQRKTDFVKSYHSTLNDFHKLISWCNFQDPTFIIHDTQKLNDVSDELKHIIENTKYISSIKEFIYECASTLVKEHVEKVHENMCAAIQNYILEEYNMIELITKQQSSQKNI